MTNSSLSPGLDRCQEGFRGYSDGFDTGFEAGVGKFEFTVCILFFSMLLNAVSSSSFFEALASERVAEFVEAVSFSLAFVAAGFLFFGSYVDLIRVVVNG